MTTSSGVLQFPVQTDFQLHMLQSIRAHCARNGLDRRKVERDFMAAGCTKQAQNALWESTRQHNLGHGPKGGCVNNATRIVIAVVAALAWCALIGALQLHPLVSMVLGFPAGLFATGWVTSNWGKKK